MINRAMVGAVLVRKNGALAVPYAVRHRIRYRQRLGVIKQRCNNVKYDPCSQSKSIEVPSQAKFHLLLRQSLCFFRMP